MITHEQIDQIHELKSKRYSISKIAREVGTSRPTVKKYLEEKPLISKSRTTDPESNPEPINELEERIKLLENKKLDLDIEHIDAELEEIYDTKTAKEKSKLYGKMHAYKRREKEAKELEREKAERKEAELREKREKEYHRMKEIWLNQKAEEAVSILKSSIPQKFNDILKTQQILSFKSIVKKQLQPLYNKESNDTIKKLINELANDYSQEHITSSPEFKKRNKEELIDNSLYHLSIKLGWDFNLDYNDKDEIKNKVRTVLEDKLDGSEEEDEVRRMAEKVATKISSPILKQKRKDELVKNGVDHTSFQLIRSDLDYDERVEIKDEIKEELEEILTGDETEDEVKTITENILDDLLEEEEEDEISYI